MVYVIDNNGLPLMPTNRCGHVRRLLKANRAAIVSYTPFTIRLLYSTTRHTQEVSLGVDTGSKHIGFSATTASKVLFEAQVDIHDDVSRKLRERKVLRKNRRAKHTRYRKQRSLNRISSKPNGWIAPSIRYKVHIHCYWVNRLCNIMPVSRIIIEVGQFDIQSLMATDMNRMKPYGLDYTHGEQHGFHATREYVIHRDGNTCVACHGSSKDTKLHVHHIQSRQIAGNAPNNLVTLCRTCHSLYHKGLMALPNSIQRGKSYKDAAAVGIMKPYIMDAVKKMCGPSILCEETYGYMTKAVRMQCGLCKAHHIDARCISGNPRAVSSDGIVYMITKIRDNNRQLHTATYNKFGIRRRAQAPKEVHGYRLLDTVRFEGSTCIISGRRSNGFFSLMNLTGKNLTQSVSYKKLTLMHHNQSYLMTQMVPTC